MNEITILRHEHPDEDLKEAPDLAAIVAERYDEAPQVGNRILDAPKGVGATEWRVYERGLYPRQGDGVITITLCPVSCDPAYFRRTANKHLEDDE